MADATHKKRIWGWMMYDWATQPFHTLLLTFIFGPYFAEQIISHLIENGMDAPGAKAKAQSIWGFGLTITGLIIAFTAPVLGAIADGSKRRMPWIWVFSAFYFVGAGALWIATPTDFPINWVLVFFGMAMIGVEYTTVFTNALLPDLGSRDEIGRISGNGWAWGYVGGLITLVIMLLLFAENTQGTTLLGNAPALGLDAETREGTRFVGPFAAIWFAVSMILFFAWVRDPRGDNASVPIIKAATAGLRDLKRTLKTLPQRPSQFAYLGSSLFYRDALNGVFTFGGFYALGALEWSVVDTGIFGILGVITGAIFAYLGGFWDQRFGPKPVIIGCILVLIAVCASILTITTDSLFFIYVGTESAAPDIAFFACGGVIGAAGGAIQSASRTMMVRQSSPERMTEAFGLYALSGKSTAFLAPALITIVSTVSGSQSIGITPLIGLFLIGLILLIWVNPEGENVK